MELVRLRDTTIQEASTRIKDISTRIVGIKGDSKNSKGGGAPIIMEIRTSMGGTGVIAVLRRLQFLMGPKPVLLLS